MSRTPHLDGSNFFILVFRNDERGVQTGLAVVSNRAVEQFAATVNNAAHDRQWAKCEAPNPNKEVRNFHFLLA